jgi:PAS domain S-box-containing protein
MDLKHIERAVQSLNINGAIIDVSPAWLALTGYSQEEVIGHFFMEFIALDSLEQVKKNFPVLKDFGYVNNIPLKIKCKNDRVISVRLTGTSKYNEVGGFERTFCEIQLEGSVSEFLALKKFAEHVDVSKFLKKSFNHD